MRMELHRSESDTREFAPPEGFAEVLSCAKDEAGKQCIFTSHTVLCHSSEDDF